MSEWVLVAVIAALLVERVLHARVEGRDRQRLISAIVAKDGKELAVLDRIEKDEPRLHEPKVPQPVPYGLGG